jgi:NAD+ diphosphatase
MLVPQTTPAGPSADPSFVFWVRKTQVAIQHEAGTGTPTSGALFVGTLHGRHCWVVDLDAEPPAEETEPGVDWRSPEVGFTDLMSLFGTVDETTWVAAGRSVQLVEWSRTHRYCGRCAAPTEETPGERSRRCPRCGLLAFPRLAPAVITLIERDDGRALLARNAAWRMEMYSCLAGFVEPGENLEDAVRREVREEVGIEVDDLRYHSSQPWPFPHSLMLGFEAHYAGGQIECDGSEIADAQWFLPDELPNLPGPVSIARRLIDSWVARYTGRD